MNSTLFNFKPMITESGAYYCTISEAAVVSNNTKLFVKLDVHDEDGKEYSSLPVYLNLNADEDSIERSFASVVGDVTPKGLIKMTIGIEVVVVEKNDKIYRNIKSFFSYTPKSKLTAKFKKSGTKNNSIKKVAEKSIKPDEDELFDEDEDLLDEDDDLFDEDEDLLDEVD